MCYKLKKDKNDSSESQDSNSSKEKGGSGSQSETMIVFYVASSMMNMESDETAATRTESTDDLLECFNYKVDEMGVKHLLNVLKYKDPRYIAHQAEVKKRKQLADEKFKENTDNDVTDADTTQQLELTSEDKKLMKFLEKQKLSRDADNDAENSESDPEYDNLHNIPATNFDSVYQKKKRRAAAKSKESESKFQGPIKLKDNFTKGCLVKEESKKDNKSDSLNNKPKSNVTVFSKETDDIDDAIICPKCNMNFNKMKQLQDHFKKNPDHDVKAVEEAEKAAKVQAELEANAAAKGGNKTKQKRHGHRKF